MRKEFYPTKPDFLNDLQLAREKKLNQLAGAKKEALITSATDFEGPLVIGDTTDELMSLIAVPQNPVLEIDYGHILYYETYDAYTKASSESRKNGNKKLQEGTDINFTLPIMLARGVTHELIDNIALKYRKTPGADNVLSLFNKNGLLVAVTTAWQDQHDLIGQQLGLDGVVGSAYPIDLARENLIRSGRLEIEAEMTEKYLDDVFRLIESMETTEGEDKNFFRENLHKRITSFFADELGVFLKNGTKTKTLLGEIINGLEVIGDHAKASVATTIFEGRRGATIAIGDGSNDVEMLKQTPYSIGLNGPDAAKGAKMGIITEDVSVLTEVYSILIDKPGMPVDDWISESRGALVNRAVVHKGGEDVSEGLLQEHKEMKKKIRGVNIAACM